MNIGILGGGQLARLLILSGKPLGMDFTVLTEKVSPTTRDLASHVLGDLSEQQVLDQLLDAADVLTFENENIPVAAVNYLSKYKNVFPNSEILALAQDRLSEKTLFQKLAIPTNVFYAVDSVDDLQDAVKQLGFPFILKSRRDGYDGKYHYRMNAASDIDALASKNDLQGHIAEAFVDFDYEISALATRDQQANVVCYDICENQHHQGILHKTFNRADHSLLELALGYLKEIMLAVDYVGTMALEFFVKDNTLLANEIAPRVHNSGHWTIDACYTSQFENHIRAISGLPLGDSRSFMACEMTNVIGQWPDRNKLLQTSGLCLHDYQKAPRLKRKVGHFVVRR